MKNRLQSGALAAVAMLMVSGCATSASPHLNALIFVANLTARSVSVFDGRTMARVATVAVPGGPHSISAEPGGRRVWTANFVGDSTTVIDVPTKQIVTTISTCLSPTKVAFSRDQHKAFVACAEGYVTVIDTLTLTPVGREVIGFNPHDIVAGPGSRMWAVNRGSNDMSEIDATTNRLLARYPVGLYANGLAFSPNGTYAYVASATWASLVVVSMRDKMILGAIRVGGDPTYVAASNDGRRVYVTNGKDGTTSIVNAHTFQVIRTIRVGTSPHGLALSDDGDFLFVASVNSSVVSMIETRTGRVLRHIVPQQGASDVELVKI